MITIKCNTKKLTVDIIDECESTPGISRQITEFKSYVLSGLRRKLSALKANDPQIHIKLADILSILDNNNFKLLKSSVKDGNIINQYEYIGE